MSPAARAQGLPTDFLERLSGALAAPEPGAAIREALAACALPGALLEQVTERARLIGERARLRDPRASATEVQLALGVLLALSGALASEDSVTVP